MPELSIVAFDEKMTSEAAAWRYDPPFDIYDGDPAQANALLDRSDSPFGYYAVVDDEDALVAFCCFGSEAQVQGQAPASQVLDVGGGVRPDLLGQGLARALFPAVLQFGEAMFAPVHFRTAVAAFNRRSLRLCRSAGFTTERIFDGPGHKFHELVRLSDLVVVQPSSVDNRWTIRAVTPPS